MQPYSDARSKPCTPASHAAAWFDAAAIGEDDRVKIDHINDVKLFNLVP
ncbi:MAG: hypothetical protein ABJD53_12915 [Gammaproteobacteria bacterium]